MNYPDRAIRRTPPTHFASRRQCHGFTLVELLATLAIASILMARPLPTMNSLGSVMKLSSFSNDFLSQLHLARGEAIKRNSHVVICKSGDGSSCSTSGDCAQRSIRVHGAD